MENNRLLNNHEYDYKDEKNDFDDDDDSLGEYAGDLGLNKFNEDGSFIGLYANKKDKKHPSPSRTSRTQTAVIAWRFR